MKTIAIIDLFFVRTRSLIFRIRIIGLEVNHKYYIDTT